MAAADVALVAMAIGLCLSCADVGIGVEIDLTVPEPHRAEIARAAESWRSMLVTSIDIVDRGEWLIIEAPNPTTYGMTQRRFHLVRIDPTTPDEKVYGVALHEFGHVVGLEHVTSGVMNADANVTEFSALDLAECIRVSACSP